MAAFYTSADVTAYLARATLGPLVVDRIFEIASGKLRPAVLGRLAREPERYVSASMRHGRGRPVPAGALPGALADNELGLPCETWIEVHARQNACDLLICKLRSGAVETTADMLTCNLDLGLIALDAVALLDEPAAGEVFEAVGALRILDPTCGAGHFLLAAFEILLDLQVALLARVGGRSPATARRQAAQAIVERQLFGVDLLPETGELCRAQLRDRARLEGAAVLEVPHVRVGNVVAGFDWEGEFEAALSDGGFHVILGNPPYLATRRLDYRPEGPAHHRDVYGFVLDRCLSLCHRQGAIGMVLPLSITFGREQEKLRGQLLEFGDGWFASFDNIPSPLFVGVSQRCTTWIGRRSPAPRCFVTELRRWRTRFRPHLLETLSYTPHTGSVARSGRTLARESVELPRIAGEHQRELLDALSSAVRRQVSKSDGPQVGYSQAARNFLSVFRESPPCFDAATLAPVPPTKIAWLRFPDETLAAAALGALSGDVFFWYWLARGDGFDVTDWLVRDFTAVLHALDGEHLSALAELGRLLHARRQEALVFKKNAGRYVGNYNWRKLGAPCGWADHVLLAGLGVRRDVADLLASDVRRILAVNARAGEKGLPAGLQARRQLVDLDTTRNEAVGHQVQHLLAPWLGPGPISVSRTIPRAAGS